MAIVVYRDAYMLIDGVALQGELTELTVEYGAESLDNTTFGATTRRHKGGLLTAMISASGQATLGTNSAEETISGRIATDDIIVAVFPNSIVEGSQYGAGFAMKGEAQEIKLGGAVGTLLPFSFTVNARSLS